MGARQASGGGVRHLSTLRRALAIASAVGAVLFAARSAAAIGWDPDAQQRARLLARQIVVHADVDPSGASGRAKAAVWIAAPPSVVYAWMTDCGKALSYVPNMKQCRVIDRSADRSSETILHEIDYSWFLPRTRYIFRAHYRPAARVEFEQVSGDLEINQGVWNLTATPDANHTLVTYEVRIKPRMYVPQWLVRRSLRKDLPDLLTALRRASEAAATEP